MSVEVTFSTTELTNALRALTRPLLDVAVAQALADTQKAAAVKAASAIAKHMGLPSSKVKDKIITPYVQVGSYVAYLKASRKPVPLINYNVKQKADGVWTNAWGKPQTIRGAFIATMPSGHRGVFRRVHASRLPIRELWGPTIAGTFETEEVSKIIRDVVRARLPKNLARRIRSVQRQHR